ncbi:50S ribosomal protein L24 [Candidatus Roizmanbacteria bacterium CG10_big_fil_rev_8_21_14_0_10_45_7]|uniref:Large ribosomal subunit protein uL24 n=1 Tax=Candidatus Roizmanbacteria bacterium CG10_big_fil_rev_8_21_14_0_10_45_7 TaxID=1974854 RepID=A0A2M8KU89_9BACT|nr:MAG: 50S ribosomal protein L24 [Candidatus Roizmanbacteria bacterium CG10_big_fil_rev_8_21_14_0_10_45_7]
MKLRKGDTVQVLIGKDKKKQGVIERTYANSNRILVKDINKVKKHMRKSESMPQGGIIEVNRPLSVGKVMLVCPSCKKATRVGIEVGKDGKKRRICKQCSKPL